MPCPRGSAFLWPTVRQDLSLLTSRTHHSSCHLPLCPPARRAVLHLPHAHWPFFLQQNLWAWLSLPFLLGASPGTPRPPSVDTSYQPAGVSPGSASTPEHQRVIMKALLVTCNWVQNPLRTAEEEKGGVGIRDKGIKIQRYFIEGIQRQKVSWDPLLG